MISKLHPCPEIHGLPLFESNPDTNPDILSGHLKVDLCRDRSRTKVRTLCPQSDSERLITNFVDRNDGDLNHYPALNPRYGEQSCLQGNIFIFLPNIEHYPQAVSESGLRVQEYPESKAIPKANSNKQQDYKSSPGCHNGSCTGSRQPSCEYQMLIKEVNE